MPEGANVRIATLDATIADVSSHPRPFFIINRERCGQGEIELPPGVLTTLPDGFTGDLLVAPTTLAELNRAHLSVGRHRQRFLAGEPVMIMVEKLHETPEWTHGGQTVRALEERARDGLHVTVALATERMRASTDCREHWKMKTGTRRKEIFARLAPDLVGLSPGNFFDAGQRLIGKWYPGQKTHQVMKSAYESVANYCGTRTGQANLAAVEAGQTELVRTAGAIYAKTLALLGAQNEMSERLREMKDGIEYKNADVEEQYDMQATLLLEKAPAQHQTLAHDEQYSPTLAQFMRAASEMDFNPAWVFLNVKFYATELECAALLGRSERGIGAMLKPTHIARLRRFMVLADAADGHGGAAHAEVEAAICLRDLALRVKPRLEWDEFFAIAETDGGSLWVAKAP